MSTDDRGQLARFVRLFDERQYWHAHEVLEQTWRRRRDPCLQGLIQVAAIFVHVDATRWRSALTLTSRALNHLAACRSQPGGIDFEVLRRRLRGLSAHLAQLSSGENGQQQFDERQRLLMAPMLRARAGS